MNLHVRGTSRPFLPLIAVMAWLAGCSNPGGKGDAAGTAAPPVAANPPARQQEPSPAVGHVAAPAAAGPTVTLRGKPLTLLGRMPKVGDAAPPFTAVANDMSTFTFDPGAGKVWLLSAVPSLDTPTCSTETRKFNESTDLLGPGVTVLTLSMDLPFAQKRWCGAEGVRNVQTVSDYRDRAFGAAYGVGIKENGLLARCIIVVGRDGKVAYVQLVPELSHEPDYAAALAAARMAADRK